MIEKTIISEAKKNELLNKMQELRIFEEDIEEKFILASNKGGQKVNKTASCVYLKHLPTGIEIKCQKERTRALNRFFARRLLCEKILENFDPKNSKKTIEMLKIKKQKANRARKRKIKQPSE